MITPAVVLKSKFVRPESKEFIDYIDYIDREDAKRNISVGKDITKKDDFKMFHSFMDYMGDDDKQGSLFTADKDELTNEDAISIKEDFKKAQDNKSLMWQDVISFDNDWLEQQGIYDSSKHELNETYMKDVVREVMESLLKNENMEESSCWTASFHYNTDNIHVHVATVEPYPTKEKINWYDKERKKWEGGYRGKRKQSTLNKRKSAVANNIVDRTEEYQKLDKLIRGTVHYKKENDISFASEDKTKELFFVAMNKLPNDLKQWKYGYHSINEARPHIDEIVDVYLETYHKDEMKELNQMLDEQVEFSKELYGEGSNFKNYKENKLDDLKKRMGNAVLTEMRSFKMDQRNRLKNNEQREGSYNKTKKQSSCKHYKEKSGVYFAMIRMKVAMRKTFREYETERNIAEYDRMLDGYDYEK